MTKFKLKKDVHPIHHFPGGIGRVDLTEASDEFIKQHIDIIDHLVEPVEATKEKPAKPSKKA